MIKKAGLKDLPVIVKLWVEFMKDHDSMVLKRNKKLKPYTVKRKNAANKYKTFAMQNIKSRNGAIFIAEVDGIVVGFTLVFVKDEIPVFKIEKMGYISDLYVKKEFRGMKIGKKLFQESIKWFKKKGLKHISLGTYTDNTFARSIYKKWGFFDYKLEIRRRI